jgi:hypothetical protein
MIGWRPHSFPFLAWDKHFLITPSDPLQADFKDEEGVMFCISTILHPEEEALLKAVAAETEAMPL